jgi:hypothetical protein
MGAETGVGWKEIRTKKSFPFPAKQQEAQHQKIPTHPEATKISAKVMNKRGCQYTPQERYLLRRRKTECLHCLPPRHSMEYPRQHTTALQYKMFFG